jgi:hypothetical protein
MAWLLSAAKGIFVRSETPKTERKEFLEGGTDEKVGSIASDLFEGVEKTFLNPEDGRISPFDDNEIPEDPTAPEIDRLYNKALAAAAAAAAEAAAANEGSTNSSTGSSPVLSDLEGEKYDPILRPLSASDIVEETIPLPPQDILDAQKYKDEFETLVKDKEIAEKEYLKDLYVHYRKVYKEHIDGTEDSDPTFTINGLFDAVRVLLEVDDIGDENQRANFLDHVFLNNLRYKTTIENITQGNQSKSEDISKEALKHLESYYANAFEEYSLQRDLFKNTILNQFSNNSLKEFAHEVLEDKKLLNAREFSKAKNETYLEIIYLVMNKALKEKSPSDNLIASIETVLQNLKRHISSDEGIRAYLKTFETPETIGYFDDVSRDLDDLRPSYIIRRLDRLEDRIEIKIIQPSISSSEKLLNTKLEEITPLITDLNKYQDLFDDTIRFISSGLATLIAKKEVKKQEKAAPKPEPKLAAAAPLDYSSSQDRLKIKRRLINAFEHIKKEMKKEKPHNDPLFINAISQTLKDKKIFNIDKIELHKLPVEDLMHYHSSIYSNFIKVSSEKLADEKFKPTVQKILKEKSIPTLETLIKLLDIADDDSIDKKSDYAKTIQELIETLTLLIKNFKKKSS